MRRTVGLVTVLTAIWVLAWGALSWANVLSGLVVATALVRLVPDVCRATHLPIVRPLPTLALAAHVVRDVVVSNVVLSRQVLARRPRPASGVVRVPLAGCSDQIVTVITTLVALTPGTMPVQVDEHPTVMYVHVLRLRDPDDVRRGIWRLRDRVLAAFGTGDALAEVERVKRSERVPT